MRWLLGILIVLIVAGFGLFQRFSSYPETKYFEWISGKGWNNFYSISNYRSLFLRPQNLAEIKKYEEDYIQLWKSFPIRNTLVPLPTRHPLFITIPILEFTSKKEAPQIGIRILSSEKRELSRLTTLPQAYYQDHSMGQSLFKLPFFKKRILKYQQEKVWEDIFSFEIKPEKKSIDDMVYDLFILHLRAKILPDDVIGFGMINDGKMAVIEIKSDNQDYRTELVMKQNSGIIYSYMIRTELLNEESVKLRSKFLQSINFSPADEAMSRALYTEFKQLNFARQVDQEGMLYLFSAFSQNTENIKMLEDMIFYLEKGSQTKDQLRPIYEYAFKTYGKTFTTRSSVIDEENPDLALEQKIEIEKRQNLLKAAEPPPKPAPIPLTPEEKMNLYLKKAKEEGAKKGSEMNVY